MADNWGKDATSCFGLIGKCKIGRKWGWDNPESDSIIQGSRCWLG